MKLLTLVVHEPVAQDLMDLLRCNDYARGFTATPAQGHSCRTQHNPFETVRDKVQGYAARVRVEVLVEDASVEPLLDLLRGCDSCVTGLGIWWVTALEGSGYL
jgi:hypothetical protein